MFKPVILSTIIIFTLGCDSEDTSTGNGSVATVTQLNGTWTSNCIVSGPTLSSSSTVTFTSGNGSATSSNFSDDTCTAQLPLSNSETFTYTLGDNLTVDGSVAGITTATQIDFIDTTIGPMGTVDYNIIALSGSDRVHLGDVSGSNDGTTPALRPTQLSDLITFTKQ